MEQFRYYGKGRYFAVTNKYSGKPEFYGVPIHDIKEYALPKESRKYEDEKFGDGHGVTPVSYGEEVNEFEPERDRQNQELNEINYVDKRRVDDEYDRLSDKHEKNRDKSDYMKTEVNLQRDENGGSAGTNESTDAVDGEDDIGTSDELNPDEFPEPIADDFSYDYRTQESDKVKDSIDTEYDDNQEYKVLRNESKYVKDFQANERYDTRYQKENEEKKEHQGFHQEEKDFHQTYPQYERYDENKYIEDIKETNGVGKYEEAKRERNIDGRYLHFERFGDVERLENRESQRYMEDQRKEESSTKDLPKFENYKDQPLLNEEKVMKDNKEPLIEETKHDKSQGYYDEQNCYEIDVDDVGDDIMEDNEKDKPGLDAPTKREFVEEEVTYNVIPSVESNQKSLEALDESDHFEENYWPPPPEEKVSEHENEKIENKGKREKENYDQQSNEISTKDHSSLYTSFLTIDVTSGKRDSLDAPQLAEKEKYRSSLLNLVTGTIELEQTEEHEELDKDDKDKIRHDLEMISKYLHNMPLGASFWPQNYDVLRDLVKLYLASKSTSNAALNYLLDHFLKLDWPELFLKCARKIMKNYPQVFVHSSDQKIPFEDPTPETLDMTQVSLEYAVAVIFQVILSLAAEFTEVHEPSKQNGCKGFIRFIFQELLPKLHGVPWGQSTAREEFLHSAIDILYNYSQATSNAACFYECNAIDILINLRKETDYIGGNRVNIGALLTLTFFIDDRNNHLIFADSAPISLLIHYIEESLSKIDHCYADFSLSELIDGLTRIASHDQNKFAICSHVGTNAISKVLRKSDHEEELIAICRLIWCLSFVEKCKQKILKKSKEIIEVIRDLQKSKNKTLQQLAESLIWEFEDKYSDLSQSAKVEVKHVFISYHAENRDTILRISDRLTENGYKVWLEKSNGESYSRHLTEAVENAAVVVIAISRKYKQSPSVFAEADYSFKLCKPMIPIALERNFKPDGWLGMLAGSKVWLDFTEESKFEGHMQMLLRQIGEKGKSERGANIAYVNGQANKESSRDYSENRLIDISRWGNEEVLDWLQQKNLKSCIAEDKLKKLRGPHLLRLHHLRRESPDFYYNSLEPQLGFTDVIDMMEFTQALESLTELQ